MEVCLFEGLITHVRNNSLLLHLLKVCLNSQLYVRLGQICLEKHGLSPTDAASSGSDEQSARYREAS